MGASRVATGIIVVAPIQAQRGALLVRGLVGDGRDLDHKGIEQGIELLHVGPIGPGHDTSHGHAFALGQQVALGAAFPPVDGVAAGAFGFSGSPFLPSGALIKQPSADCQWRSRPTNSSYSSKRRVQAWANAPVRTHSWKRSCTVDFGPNSRGTAPHWAPVRSTQITPSKRGRSFVRGRPGFLRGLTTTNKGARRAHSASSARQIVGSSLGAAGVAGVTGVTGRDAMGWSLSVAGGGRRREGHDAPSSLP
jgi:hypothetical protein